MDNLSGFLCSFCCGWWCLLGFLICRELLLRRLQGESIADKELSVLLAREQLVPPVVHGTTYDALREISPLLASRNGLNTPKIRWQSSRPSSVSWSPSSSIAGVAYDEKRIVLEQSSLDQ